MSSSATVRLSEGGPFLEEHAARLDATRLTLWVALASCVAAVSVALASDNPVWALAVTALLAAIALATTDESPVRARVAITIAAASFIGLHAAVGLETRPLPIDCRERDRQRRRNVDGSALQRD